MWKERRAKTSQAVQRAGWSARLRAEHSQSAAQGWTHIDRMPPYADPQAAILFDDGIMAVKDNAMIWYWHKYEEEAEHFSL